MAIPFIEDFGGGVGVTDNTPAFDAAVLAGESVRFRDTVTMVGGGRYRFATEPAKIDKSFAIYGALPNVPALCWIDRDYQPSDPTRGLFHWTKGQGYVNDLMFLAKSGSQGAAISIVPRIGGDSAQYGINNCRITTNGGSWNHDIYANGNNLTVPQGVRGLTIFNCMLFGTNSDSIHLDNCVHFNIIGGSINQAGGTLANLWIGSGTPTLPATTGTVRLDYMTGNIILDRATEIVIDVAMVGGSVNNTSNTLGIRGRGHVYGTIQNNWINSSWT